MKRQGEASVVGISNSTHLCLLSMWSFLGCHSKIRFWSTSAIQIGPNCLLLVQKKTSSVLISLERNTPASASVLIGENDTLIFASVIHYCTLPSPWFISFFTAVMVKENVSSREWADFWRSHWTNPIGVVEFSNSPKSPTENQKCAELTKKWAISKGKVRQDKLNALWSTSVTEQESLHWPSRRTTQ